MTIAKYVLGTIVGGVVSLIIMDEGYNATIRETVKQNYSVVLGHDVAIGESDGFGFYCPRVDILIGKVDTERKEMVRELDIPYIHARGKGRRLETIVDCKIPEEKTELKELCSLDVLQEIYEGITRTANKSDKK